MDNYLMFGKRLSSEAFNHLSYAFDALGGVADGPIIIPIDMVSDCFNVPLAPPFV